MVLSRPSVIRLIELKQLIIDPFRPHALDEHGVLDLTLSRKYIVPERPRHPVGPPYSRTLLEGLITSKDGYLLKPGRFVVFETEERLELGHRVFCLLSTRPTMAKLGLDFIQSSSFVPPLSRGRLRLETSNRGEAAVRLYPEVAVIKAVFMRMD
jgi:deoxycytidine triphosphate deaminase